MMCTHLFLFPTAALLLALLTATTYLPPTHSFSSNSVNTPSRPVSSWTIPRNVKFGKLSNLVLIPDEDRAQKARFRPEQQQQEEPATIRVATASVGLNFADVFTVLGLYKAANQVRAGRGRDLDPFVPGIEFSGVVLDGGSGSDGSNGFQVGDKVFGFARFGAYADVVEARPEHLRKLPDSWSFEQGSGFLVNALTAWHGLVNVGGMPGSEEIAERSGNRPYLVVVHSASGGVGLWASEIAARSGAAVVGIVGSEAKVETFMDRVGSICPSAQCIVRGEDVHEFERRLVEACRLARSENSYSPDAPGKQDMKSCRAASEAGYGADLVMECYGGRFFRPSLDIINAGGTLSTYGSTTYNGDGRGENIPFWSLLWRYLVLRPRVDPGELTSRNVRVGGFNLIFLTEDTNLLVKSLDACVECLGESNGDTSNSCFETMMESVTPPIIGSAFSFDFGAVDALKALRSGKTVGKVVLTNERNPALKDVAEISESPT